MDVALQVADDAWEAVFLGIGLRRGLHHTRTASWSTAVTAMPRLGAVVASSETDGEVVHVVERDDGAVRVRLHDGWVVADVAAATTQGADALLSVVRHQLPAPPAPDATDPAADIGFWVRTDTGPFRRERTLDVPTWASIAGNYPEPTRAALDALMTAQLPLDGGRLVVWHGPPGTGKTNALRALAWEWRDVADLQYATDPEQLLTHPGYLQAVLTSGSARDWRVLVLEDAPPRDLLQLLNVTDGFVGQAFRVLVLVTGNEPAERLPPALLRPGRCAAQVAFERFDAAGATRWLGTPTTGPASLAELYALRDGRPVPERARQIGFAA